MSATSAGRGRGSVTGPGGCRAQRVLTRFDRTWSPVGSATAGARPGMRGKREPHPARLRRVPTAPPRRAHRSTGCGATANDRWFSWPDRAGRVRAVRAGSPRPRPRRGRGARTPSRARRGRGSMRAVSSTVADRKQNIARRSCATEVVSHLVERRRDEASSSEPGQAAALGSRRRGERLASATRLIGRATAPTSRNAAIAVPPPTAAASRAT